jgi:hypothetical protein
MINPVSPFMRVARMEDLVESVKDTILTIKQAAQRSRVHRSRIDAAIAGRELSMVYTPLLNIIAEVKALRGG